MLLCPDEACARCSTTAAICCSRPTTSASTCVLEPDLDTGPVAVHGQLADRRDPLKGLGGSAVLLMDGERVAGWMFGNRNGEFVFEVRPGTGLRLCLPITERGRIEIPLDPLLGAGGSE